WELAWSASGAAEGIGSLLGWRKGVRQKKTETRRKIVKGSRKACQGLGRYGPRIKLRHQAKDWTIRWELAGSLLGLHRRRSIVDTSVPQGGGLGSGRRSVGVEPL
ncbi:hypothetical protein B296_00057030, partial [Ensete ventricosum]